MTLHACPKCDTTIEDEARFCPNCGENLLEASSGSDDPHVGQQFSGFLVQELIGMGAMGRVYKGEQLSLGKTVAIKILHQHLLGDPSLEKRFQREARAAAKLQHPNCISVIDFGKSDDGALYIAMEYLEGANLGQILQEGPMPWPRAVHILDQVASALDEAHSAGIIHRDLKPENIVLEQRRNEADFVKVLDFGIAKVQESDNREGVLTMVGAVCGTPEYMAPEQARGETDLDVRADIYAMGCILYHMLTGELPFSGDSVMAVITKQLSEAPTPPRELKPDLDIPPSIERLCMKALSKDREDRPASAMIFGQDLSALAAAIHSGPFEARTSSQTDSAGETETTLPPQVTRGKVMPNNALATGESVMASMPAPSGLAEADAIARAVTPTDHLAGLRSTLAMEDGEDPPTDQAHIDTTEADMPPDDAGPPPRAPEASNHGAKTSPATPLHPTPVLAGEVIDTGQTAVYEPGAATRKLAIAAGLAVCVAVGAIWALTGGPPEGAKEAAVVATGAVPAPVDDAADIPVIPEADPAAVPPVEPPPPEVEPDPVEASVAAPKAKRKSRKKKQRRSKPKAAASPPPSTPAPPKPAPAPPAPRAQPKVSKAKGLYAQAGTAFNKGKHDEAVSLYREAMVAGYRKPEIHYQLGRAYMRMSRAEDARRQFETYLKKYPKSPKRKMVEAILKQGR